MKMRQMFRHLRLCDFVTTEAAARECGRVSGSKFTTLLQKNCVSSIIVQCQGATPKQLWLQSELNRIPSKQDRAFLASVKHHPELFPIVRKLMRET